MLPRELSLSRLGSPILSEFGIAVLSEPSKLEDTSSNLVARSISFLFRAAVSGTVNMTILRHYSNNVV
jgi:hypothetical protein